jgi:hypothetical protein
MLTVGTGWWARSAIAPSTVRGYAAHVRLYLAPYLGEVLLAGRVLGQQAAADRRIQCFLDVLP